MMDIRIASTDEDITACCEVMRELRPHVAEDEFLTRVRRQETQGYRLAAAWRGDEVVGVAGFRTSENLFYGRNLYVDDLVTRASERSQGVGSALLDWLYQRAAQEDCRCLHLDSGVQRKDAHRFYLREKMPLVSYHFARLVE